MARRAPAPRTSHPPSQPSRLHTLEPPVTVRPSGFECLESQPIGTRPGRSPERVERRTIQPLGKLMSVIAKAIADRQSEIERTGGDPGVERRRQDARDLRSGEARGSALLLAAAGGCGHPGRGDRVRRQADEEAPTDDGRREEGGFRADDSLLGRAQKESREVARRGRGEYVPRPRSVYPSDRRSSEVVPATRGGEPSVAPARPRGPRRGRTRRPPPPSATATRSPRRAPKRPSHVSDAQIDSGEYQMIFSVFRKATKGTEGMPRMPAAVFTDIFLLVSLRSSVMTRASVPSFRRFSATAST